MDVTVQAFELTTGKGITLEALKAYIEKAASKAVDGRLLYIDKNEGWWKGLMLTARDIKAFSRMERKGRRIRLSPQSITNGELAHFNFFLFHEKRRRGLFQYYHGSASIHGFAQNLKRRYNTLRDVLISNACKEAGEDPDNPPKKIKSRYSGALNYQLVLRRKSFEDMIRDLKGISNVSIQFTEYRPGNRIFRSLAEKAKTVRHNLTFRDKYDGSLKDDLIAISRKRSLKDLRGVGIENGDIERRFRFLREPESLGKFDFNDIVLETEFDSDDVHNSLSKSPLLDRLMEIAQSDNWIMGRV